VGGLDFFAARKIGDGAADFEDAAVGPGAQTQFVDGGFEQSLGGIIDGTIPLDIARSRFRRLSGVAAGEVLVPDRRQFKRRAGL